MKHYNLKDPMDDHSKRGDLYIQFEIVFPLKIST